MKLHALAALVAIPLLAGCAGTPAASSTQAAPTAETVAVVEPGPAPIILDLWRQVMTIPGTEYGTMEVPVLAAGDVLAGSSTITAPPADAAPYSHCEDLTAGWATEPNAAGVGAWARPLQFVSFDRDCKEVSTISGHAVIVPSSVGSDGIGRWLTEGRQITVVGQSPYPDPNLGSLAEVDLQWPDDRPSESLPFIPEGK